MRPSDVAKAIVGLIPTKRPLFLWGPPGVGKSSIVRQAAAQMDLDMCDLRAVLLDPVDLRGLPTVAGDRAVWLPPAFLPRDGKGILFFDELPQGPPMVQASMMQLTLDRKVGEYYLPEGWTVIAAGNRQEDRAGTHKLITPLLNRFIHIDLEVSNEDWLAWALNGGIAPEVRAFINFKPNLLFAFDASSGKRAFPTPRSWEFVSDIINYTPEELLMQVVSGCVGDGPAAEFCGFCRIYRDLPNVDDVLANPLKTTMPKEPAVLYALAGALTEKCRNADQALLGRFMAFANRMPDEFGVLCVRDSLAINSRVLTAPGASDWMKKHKEVLLGRAG